MPDDQRRLILGNAEGYISALEIKRRGGPPEWPRPYGEARDRIKSQVDAALRTVASLPRSKKFDDETVLCLRLHPDMGAKSYDPSGLFGVVRELENVGSRYYRVSVNNVAKTKRINRQIAENVSDATGRLVFVRSDEAGFRRMLRVLDRPERELHKSFREEIQSIERFDLLDLQEQLLGFPEDWAQGRIELVLHPSTHSEAEQRRFINSLLSRGHDPQNVRISAYPNGPTFVSCFATRSDLAVAAGANPIRAAHPMTFGGISSLRGSPTFASPPPPQVSTRSTIKVGIFDGGVDVNHPLLKGHVEEDLALSIQTVATVDGIAHGTAVAGVALHGALNDADEKKPLPAPLVSVVSVRVLPTSNSADADLYECIDRIEAAVPARPDVRVWNLSFGPRGPILDDSISRFTYALDELAVAQKVEFCVAVGNDGDAGPMLGRIQAPSDLVNGLGVGAHTRRQDAKVHATYSCVGHGRECAKIKPDVSAFGGCSLTPIHLIDSTHGRKVLSYGTSFASPQAAALSGQALGRLDRATGLLARALLVHRAVHPDGEPDTLLGHGVIPATVDDLLRCGDKEVTIIFQSSLVPKRQVKLPILLPPDIISSGKLSLRWTVACLPPVNPNHPADYTGVCIQDTFYPNDQVFTFSKKDKKVKYSQKRLHLRTEAAEVGKLLAEGWRQSALPVSDSGNAYPTEHESRAMDYKWEPVVRRSSVKYASSLRNPFLVLHAIPRHAQTVSQLDYAVVVTIAAPKFSGDLYSEILRRFVALQPVRVRSEAEIRVQI